jgi:hypothetical protein
MEGGIGLTRTAGSGPTVIMARGIASVTFQLPCKTCRACFTECRMVNYVITGKDGKRRNIGIGKISKTEENMVTKTVVGTKNGVK